MLFRSDIFRERNHEGGEEDASKAERRACFGEEVANDYGEQKDAERGAHYDCLVLGDELGGEGEAKTAGKVSGIEEHGSCCCPIVYVDGAEE